MRYVWMAVLLCGTLGAAEGVTISVDKETKLATVTIVLDATTILAAETDAKQVRLKLLDAVVEMARCATRCVAFETKAALDAETAKQIAESAARITAEANKQKQAMPVIVEK